MSTLPAPSTSAAVDGPAAERSDDRNALAERRRSWIRSATRAYCLQFGYLLCLNPTGELENHSITFVGNVNSQRHSLALSRWINARSSPNDKCFTRIYLANFRCHELPEISEIS